jgi:hypothetical protein
MDLIVETTGTFKLAESLKFAQAAEFKNKSFEVWKNPNNPDFAYGYYKHAGPLHLKLVNNAGHLV